MKDMFERIEYEVNIIAIIIKKEKISSATSVTRFQGKSTTQMKSFGLEKGSFV